MPKAATAAPAKKAAAKKVAAIKAVDEPAPSDMDLGFAPIEDLVDFINALFYGREGSGKSTAAVRVANAFAHLPPGKGKVLVINAEGGLKVKALRKRGVDLSRIVLWPDPKQHERPTHTAADRIHRKIKADLMEDPESWGAVIIDSATEVRTAFLDAVQEKRVNAIKRQGKDVDEDFVDIADYGNMSKMFRDVLRKFRDLPCHFIVTALERRDVDKDTGKPQYGPDVNPGIQSDLLGYVDFVLMFKAEDEDGPFRALTRANTRYRAKDRFDILPRVMVDPFADRILQYVNDELTPETDAEQERLPVKVSKKKAKEAEEEDEDSNDED